MNSNTRIKKAVLPVAGIGTRFLPVTKAVPKELLPIVDKPVLQYLVEEAAESGIEEVIFVISRGKELILEHFKHNPKLEAMLEAKGKTDILEKVRHIHKMAKFSYVYQDEPLGCGHAVLMAKELVGNEPFLVLFGDDIIKSDVPAAKQLIDRFEGESVLAVEHVPKEEISSYGIIKPGARNGEVYEVTDLAEKPNPEDAPSDLGIIGKYVCPPEIFEAIRSAPPGPDGELRLIDGFLRLKKKQKIWAVKVKGERFDTGRPEGLIAAANAFLSPGLHINHIFS